MPQAATCVSDMPGTAGGLIEEGETKATATLLRA
jgi:hypothetical protein